MAKRRGRRGGGAPGPGPGPARGPGDRSRAVGYLRVSTEDQAEFGGSLAQQREQIAMFCRLYKLDLVAVESDPGLSGKSLDRPGLRAALARLETGDARSLVVVKLDRLTRHVRDLGTLLEDYFGEKSRGCQLLSVEEKVDTATPEGRLLLNVLVTVAQWERETIVKRVTGALRYRQSVGQRTGGLPYGYELDPDGKHNKRGLPVVLRPNPAEVAALVVMLALRESGGSFRGIADRLDGLGYKPRGGVNRHTPRDADGKPLPRGWSPRAVDQILARADMLDTSETGAGRLIYKMTEGRPGLDFDALLNLYRTFSGKGASLASED